jgi:hypothetical protein
MSEPRFSIRLLLGTTAMVALAVTAVVNANEWWCGIIRTALTASVALSLLHGWLNQRPFFLGFAITTLVSVVLDSGMFHLRNNSNLADSVVVRLLILTMGNAIDNLWDDRYDVLVLQWYFVVGVFGGLCACWIARQGASTPGA